MKSWKELRRKSSWSFPVLSYNLWICPKKFQQTMKNLRMAGDQDSGHEQCKYRSDYIIT